MRNLKKALSLALASAMLLGMMVVGTSAFDDVAASHNEEAIAVMEAAGIMIGDDAGNFNPDQKVTRNQMAVVMSNLMDYKIDDYAGVAPFTDVPAWAEKYVSACYANGIVSGASATEYNAEGTVTVAEAGLMVMKALGYFQYASDFGSDWQMAVVKQASKIDLFKNVNGTARTAMTRNDVAQLVLNALKASTVDAYGQDGVKVEGEGFVVTTGSTVSYYVETRTGYAYDYIVNDDVIQLGEKLFESDLKLVAGDADDFGRPASHKWINAKGETIYNVIEKPTFVITAAMTNKEMGSLLKDYTYNGTKIKDEATFVASGLANGTANGKVVELYCLNDADEFEITARKTITYTVGEVEKITTNKDGDVTYKINGTSYVDYANDEDNTDTIDLAANVVKGDVVTFVVKNGTCYVYPTTSFKGNQTAKNSDGDKITVSGEVYELALGVNGVSTGSFLNSSTEYNYFVDQYGFVVDTTSTASASTDYAMLVDLYGKTTSTIDGTTPALQGRFVLADGTVGVYDIVLEKKDIDNDTVKEWIVKNFTSEINTASGNDVVNSCGLTDGGVYGYVIDGTSIKLEALTGTNEGDANTAAVSTLTDGKIDYTNALANKATIFVVYNTDDKAATVYTGSNNLPTFQATVNGTAVYARPATGTGTASVIFAETTTGTAAAAADDYVYIDTTDYQTILVDDEDKILYTGVYADGSKITLTADSAIGSAGLYTFNEDKTIDSTDAVSGAQYLAQANVTVDGDLIKVGASYYYVTEDTEIVYIDSELSEVDDNQCLVVLALDGTDVTSDVEAIFVVAD